MRPRWMLALLPILWAAGPAGAHAARRGPTVFQATPLDEENAQVQLVWRGPADAREPLRAQPVETALVVGQRRFRADEPLRFIDTRVIVEEPRVLSARRHLVLAAVSRYPAGPTRRPLVVPRGAEMPML